ncbi:holo-acyl-carrier-protein synthase [Ruminiclostridium papyrosolvens DSM 2782]|uniref:Holo-[acyl-carrier-protein] synthase n=1 Tax=Ruminiclostridium papyrosolvens DSM 2782 TaxID=588581 RepID=F1TBT6_9FIRM|nr:holo-ACP synthase [Ruminiclostridium papyrosolvens]EGD48107.1 holo-acyl-carrier-protein synthase [Ruminiclostridium papyrosolvens DSM 2782]WES35009.1 holo-ACP synthase [Ruminiclostridium papyrosolvens DSM 2782]
MIIGIGTDILKISNIEHAVSDLSDPFIKKTFTLRELDLICSRQIPLYSFATRFAGKEAVFKTFSADGNAIRLNEIEILENEVGQPIVTLHGNAKNIAEQKSINSILISLSYDTEYAIAFATALSK